MVRILLRSADMKKLPRGHVSYRGKVYVRPTCAGKKLGVFSGTVNNWFDEGKIRGVMLPTKSGSKKVLFVLKSCLTPNLYVFTCGSCSKKFRSKVVRKERERIFCSLKCRNGWWNYHAPVRNGVRVKRKDLK